MPDPVNPQAPATPPDPSAQPAQPDAATKLAQYEKELADLRTREGRFRNEKGVWNSERASMQARIQELERFALGNSTEYPAAGDPSYTPPPTPSTWNPHTQPGYNMNPYGYPPPDVVTREEWDMDRFRRENPDRFDSVRQIAMDGSKVGQFIRYRQAPDGRAIPDVYGTYSAIAQQLELQELRSRQAQSNNPNRNPAMATISGSGSNSSDPEVDIRDLTPEQIRERFPDQFAEPPKSWLKG